MAGQSFSLMSGPAPPPWLSPAFTVWATTVAPWVIDWRRFIAAAHAGWRGLAQGVLESTVAAMRQSLAGVDAAPTLLAWLGPCIGPEAFEVGAEVKAAFEASSPEAGRHFKPLGPGKWLANLSGLARMRLQAAGVASLHGNDGGPAWCTVANASRFFSHRRDRVSGRMAACIWRSA